MNMTPEQLRELDAWICEHWFDWKWYRYRPEKDKSFSGKRTLMDKPHRYVTKARGNEDLAPDALMNVPAFTTDPAAAMRLWKRCVLKCDELGIAAPITDFWRHEKAWDIQVQFKPRFQTQAPTLELAIALFARKLKAKE